jgi:hypothetical protein
MSGNVQCSIKGAMRQSGMYGIAFVAMSVVHGTFCYSSNTKSISMVRAPPMICCFCFWLAADADCQSHERPQSLVACPSFIPSRVGEYGALGNICNPYLTPLSPPRLDLRLRFHVKRPCCSARSLESPFLAVCAQSKQLRIAI